MPYRAALRFAPPRSIVGAGARRIYNEHDEVPDEIAEAVDDRCVYNDDGALHGYPAGGSIDDIAGWILEAREDKPEMLARCEAAQEIEVQAKNRKGLLVFLDDQIRNLSAPAPDADEADEGEGDEVTEDGEDG